MAGGIRVTQGRRARFCRVLVAAAVVGATIAGVVGAPPANAAGADDLDQCANGTLAAPNGCVPASAWQNGDLNSGNSHYREGDSVPFRVKLTSLSSGAHDLYIAYDSIVGGKHAYDYLTTYNRTEPAANACAGFATPCAPGTPGNIPPMSGTVNQIPGVISAWDANITSVTVFNTAVANNGDTTVTLKVSFTTTSATAVLAWGGHIASQIDWGFGNSAHSINGSPYHMATGLDSGGKVGANRSVKAADILVPPTITTQVSASTVAVGASVTDTGTFTGPKGTPTGTATFFLCGPSATAPDCTTGGTQVGGPVTLSNGSATSSSVQLNAQGVYCFRVQYVPDASAPYAAGNHTNMTSECVTVSSVPLTITKTTTTPSVSAGDQINYTITVNNPGTGSATGVVVTDNLPTAPGVTWSISPTNNACSISGNTLTCNFGTIGPNSSASVTVVSQTTFASCGQLSNTASFTSTSGSSGNTSASPTTITILCPSPHLTKRADQGTVNAGDQIGYVITYSNTGTGVAHNVVISDNLPTNPGLSWSIEPTGTTAQNCSISNAVLTCNQGDVAAGANVTVHVISQTNASTAPCPFGTVSNSASSTTGNGPNANAGPTDITVNCASVSISKTADQAAVNAGDDIGYRITVTNNGPGLAHGVTITDTLPTNPGLSWSIDAGTTTAQNCGISGGVLTCNQGDLAGGASVVVHITSHTDASTAPCPSGTVSNTASVTTTNDGGGTSGTSTDITVNCADVTIAKTADQGVVNAGDDIGYRITVTNSGPGVAHGVTITDTLPANPGLSWSIDAGTTTAQNCGISGGVLTCNQGDLGPGASVVVHITSHTDASTAPCPSGTVSNTASVTTTNDGGGTSGTSTDITVNCADVHIDKVAEQSTVNLGDDIAYRITVTNSGPGTAHGVVITDNLPTDGGLSWSIDTGATTAQNCSITGNVLTCNQGDLGPGASVVVRVVASTAAATGLCPSGTIHNTASVSTGNDGSGQVTDVPITVECPDLAIAKTTDTPTVSAGDPIHYRITVTNNGPGVARAVTVDDPLPSQPGVTWMLTPPVTGCTVTANQLHCDLGDFASGQSINIDLSSQTTAASCATLNNVASADATNDDQVNSGAPTTITVNCPDLTIAKDPDAASVSAGDPIGYTITVTNNGAGSAANVTVHDQLPTNDGLTWTITASDPTCAITAGTLDCNFGTLAPHTSASVHISSPTTPATCGTVSNSADAHSDNDGAPSVHDVAITVDCPDLGITKTTDTPTVNAGDPIHYTITVTNSGPGTAHDVTVDDDLPTGGGLTWTMTPPVTGCLITADHLHCDLGDLTHNQSVVITLSSPTSPAACATPVSNVASADASNDDPVTSGAATVITVNCPDLGITKTTDTPTVSAGDPIHFTITVTNSGPGTAHDVTVDDDLPTGGGLTWTMTPPVTGCVITADHLHCDLGDLTGGQSVVINLSSPTAPATCGTVSNSASAATTNGSPTQTAQPTTITVECPHVSVSKTADDPTPSSGDQIGFRIVVSNSGDGRADNVHVTDNLPTAAGVSWSLDPPVDGCAISGNTLTCDFSSVAAHTSIAIHVVSATTRGQCSTLNNTVNVSVANDSPSTSSATINVVCPNLSITKTANKTAVQHGDTITYTIKVTNSGTGPARSTNVDEDIPAGTQFQSCSSSCAPQGTAATHTAWDLGTVDSGETDTVTLTVTVLRTDQCLICNTASVSTPDQNGGAPIHSNQVCVNNSPPAHPENANANGSAYAALVNVPPLGVNNVTLPNGGVSSSQHGVGHDSHSDAVLRVNLPNNGSALRASLLSATADSTITDDPNSESVQRSTAEVLGVNVLNGLVTADVVQANATAIASGAGSSFSAAGSTILNLKVNGVVVTDIKPNMRIGLPEAVFGPGSYVAVFEQTGSTSGPGTDHTYRSNLEVNMIHVVVTKLLGINTNINVVVSHAVAHADFPQTALCVSRPVQTVSGHAFIASLDTTPSLLPTLVGLSSIPASGGTGEQHLNATRIPPTGNALLALGLATTQSTGQTSSTPTTASSYAEAANLCLLQTASGCTISADLVRSQANSTAGPGGASSNANGTTFVHLVVGGTPIDIPTGVNNVVLNLPGIGFVVLNEQFCDGGATLGSACAGPNHSGLTVRAIHVVISIGNNPIGQALGAEVIVAEAHSDASWSAA